MPVINHDATLERVHGRRDRIDALTAAELAAIGIPTLAETLSAVGGRAFLDVELKGELSPAVVEVLAAHRGSALSNAVVSSFDRGNLERVASLAPTWPRWLITRRLDGPTIADALDLGVEGVAVEWRALDAGPLRRAQTAGLEVVAWTVRRRPTFERLANLGVVAICVEGAALDGGSAEGGSP